MVIFKAKTSGWNDIIFWAATMQAGIQVVFQFFSGASGFTIDHWWSFAHHLCVLSCFTSPAL